jgi:hypothetical protein
MVHPLVAARRLIVVSKLNIHGFKIEYILLCQNSLLI